MEQAPRIATVTPLFPDQDVCPECNTRAAPVVYGLPSRGMFEAAQRGEIVLGGCCLPQNGTPTHSCSCGALRWSVEDDD
jgi:hypothetical protein